MTTVKRFYDVGQSPFKALQKIRLEIIIFSMAFKSKWKQKNK